MSDKECPECGRPVARSSEAFPFCSKRCKEIDLGNWAAEKYRLPVVDDKREIEISPSNPEDLPKGKFNNDS